ncbi:thioesterase superfamily [Sporothrix brasiliensis 5110]|uniref:Thioesterase superfamily n=1 Tax=Sporothrix brasiliensis 5110 TaxID=1398154 RepID=A0A0C2ISP9_9PEZI|nr:thioesterase superfamily [Sporothrix brasiliensis 5110]KIH88012.1 thioesterase superfamily [Sporothrix brasiliensis 5110]
MSQKTPSSTASDSNTPGDIYELQGRPDAIAEAEYFLSVPWCRAHLKPAEGRPKGSAATKEIRIVQPGSRRRVKPALNADGSFTSSTKTIDNAFSTTLHTRDTIGAFIIFYEEPSIPASAGVSPGYRPPILELKALMSIGPGINGHIGVAHGGIVATILDEVLGLLMPLNLARDRHNKRIGATAPPLPASTDPNGPEAAAVSSATVTSGFVTGYLNITYSRPVRTPADILVTARFVRKEGTRKYFLEGSIWDGKSQLLAKADLLFIALKERL